MVLKTSRTLLTCTLLGSSFLLGAGPASAQKYNNFPSSSDHTAATDKTSSHGLLMLGAGVAPYHMGTDKYSAIPIIAGSYRSGNKRFTTRGLGVDINLPPQLRLS